MWSQQLSWGEYPKVIWDYFGLALLRWHVIGPENSLHPPNQSDSRRNQSLQGHSCFLGVKLFASFNYPFSFVSFDSFFSTDGLLRLRHSLEMRSMN